MLCVQLLRVPPTTSTMLWAKSLLASLRVKVMVAVPLPDRLVAELVTVTVGVVVSVFQARVSWLLASTTWPLTLSAVAL